MVPTTASPATAGAPGALRLASTRYPCVNERPQHGHGRVVVLTSIRDNDVRTAVICDDCGLVVEW